MEMTWGKIPLGIEQEIQSTHEEILRVAFGPPSSDSTGKTPTLLPFRPTTGSRTTSCVLLLGSTPPPRRSWERTNHLHDTPDNHRQAAMLRVATDK